MATANWWNKNNKETSSLENITPITKGEYTFSNLNEILPEYIHENSKNMPPLTESLNYLLSEEINSKKMCSECFD